MNLFEKPQGIKTRWSSFENLKAERARGGLENGGAKGHPCDRLLAGETKTLLDVTGSGIICRMWFTIMNRNPDMLRALRIEITWDNAERPAVSAPFGDFFGVGLGRRTPFECALFSDPEGRSFNCFIPMPFRKAAKITLTNESSVDNLEGIFYDVDFLLDVKHTPETLYFHTHWHREMPNALGADFTILPHVKGTGRFLGCNLGVITDPLYEDSWWGEGEVKCWMGDDAIPTLCGTGSEDYIGTAWGQGAFANRTQGSLVADKERRQWTMYRYHIDDPVFFDDGIKVAIQTIGGAAKSHVIALQAKGAQLIPVSIIPKGKPTQINLLDRPEEYEKNPEGWVNFWRQDDWSGIAYFYLDSPVNALPPLAPVAERIAGLKAIGNEAARADT